MQDIYQREIELLTENPNRIYNHWNYGSPLFREASSKQCQKPDGKSFGCLTQIRTDKDYVAGTNELTNLIRNDTRIPFSPSTFMGIRDSIKIEDLQTFAEWQRRLDKELNRTAPEDFDFNKFYSRYGI